VLGERSARGVSNGKIIHVWKAWVSAVAALPQGAWTWRVEAAGLAAWGLGGGAWGWANRATPIRRMARGGVGDAARGLESGRG